MTMTYAEVRKAAEGYCDNEWKKETDLQVRKCIDKLTIPAFIEGANWRVNASWHDAKETPKERKFCLYILKYGSYGCGYYPRGTTPFGMNSLKMSRNGHTSMT